MIAFAGTARRSYMFPAPLERAFRFNADLDAMLALLPHIAVVGAPSAAVRRLCYGATESGLYRVRIHCTVSTEIDARACTIRIVPRPDETPPHAGFRSMSGTGRYGSTIGFHRANDETRIDYGLMLSAELPVPGSLRLVPTAVLNAGAERIFHARLEEILDGFVARSIAAYEQRVATSTRDSATVRASRDRRA